MLNTKVLVAAIVMFGSIATSHAEEADVSRARGYSIGTAIVSSQATGDCPSSYRGVTDTGQAPGTDHNACTQAKNVAKANLRGKVPQACAKYITATPPCKVVN